MNRFAPSLAAVFFGLVPAVGAADQFELPGNARITAERASPLDIYHLPLGRFSGEGLPTRAIEGPITRQSWRIDATDRTVLQIVEPLRAQIEAAGYELAFECEDTSCGGFDFRFATEVLPAPNMYVDIRDYWFVAATRGEDEAMSLLVSRGNSAAYVQIIRVGGDGLTVTSSATADEPDIAPQQPLADLATRLKEFGHAILSDLEFETGSSQLGAGPFATLDDLAEFMQANPAARLVLVGHTDSQGGLEANLALSRARAVSVRGRLIDAYQIEASRLEADGAGYLAPVATNLTESGRDANRRVEAVILTLE